MRSKRAKGYKRLVLGGVLVFMVVGPLMVVGSYFALTGWMSRMVLLA